jgi:spermidine synthase
MLQAARPQMELDVVEIDPAVVELAEKYFDVFPRPELRIHLEDAAEFLKNCTSQYELIILDAYFDDQFPDQCATDEFFRDARRRLTDDGVLAINWLSDNSEETEKLLTKLESIVGPVWQLVGLKSGNTLFFSAVKPMASPALRKDAATASMNNSVEKSLQKLATRLRKPARQQP